RRLYHLHGERARQRFPRWPRGLPVVARMWPPREGAQVDREGRGRLERPDVTKDAMGARDGAQHEIANETGRADLAAEESRGEERLDLGGEQESLGRPGAIEGFNAEAVAREKHVRRCPFAPIENREGEHAA